MTLTQIIYVFYRTSDMDNIAEVRRHLFTKQAMPMESLPPTKAAPVQHAKRVVYQGGHIWAQVFNATPVLPSAAAGDWGWKDAPEWKPAWTTLPQASISSGQVLCCGCKKAAEVAASATKLPTGVLLSASVRATVKPNQ